MKTVCFEGEELVRIKRTGCCRWIRPSDGSFQHCERPLGDEDSVPCGDRNVLDEVIREVAAEDDERVFTPSF